MATSTKRTVRGTVSGSPGKKVSAEPRGVTLAKVRQAIVRLPDQDLPRVAFYALGELLAVRR